MKNKKRLLGFFKKFGKDHYQTEHSPPKMPDQAADLKPAPLKQRPNKKGDDKVRTEKLGSAKSVAKALSAVVGIYYENKDGGVDKRRITIRRIWERGNEVLVDGYCHERKAPRIFFASRIKKIVDLKTRKAYVQARKFLLGQIAAVPGEAVAGHDGSARVINRMRNELTSLVFLAQIDDDFAPNEVRVIMNYVKARCKGMNYDPEDLQAYIQRLYPDEECFYDAMDELLDGPEEQLADFVEAFVQIILSDGVVHDDEREFLAELLQILREEGIELDVGF